MTSSVKLRQPNGVPILMYHALMEGERHGNVGGYEDPVYTIGKDRFEEHMRELAALGYETVLLRDVIAWFLGEGVLPTKSVMITFDDGHVSNLTMAIPILAKYKYYAEFFITTGYVGKPGYLDSEQIQAIRKAGMGIGSHTVSHPMLDALEVRDIEKELRISKDFLEDLLGEEVIGLSVPGGRVKSTVRSIACETGYCTVLTSRSGINRIGQDLFNMKRIPVRRSTLFSEALVLRGYDRIGARVIQEILDGGKVLLGNRRYARIRNWFVQCGVSFR